MQVTRTAIPEVMIIEPEVFGDERGFFLESWNAREFLGAIGRNVQFVQDNHSRSRRGTLRGLHYQTEQTQGKLVRVASGSVFDVAVDLRRFSPTLGHWVGVELNGDNHRQLWIPPGFAHGFLVLSDSADLLYKVSDYYAPEHERCVIWNDSEIGIRWPSGTDPILSARDRRGVFLGDAELFP